MLPLEKPLRNRLEKTIKDARDIAEAAARAALEQLGVGDATPFAHLSEAERELRRKLRVHGRQLGDTFLPSPSGRGAGGEGRFQTLERLVEEVAYEHWHRMLFARFLAENNLLMYPDPDEPVAVTLEECDDLAADEGAANGWELAARFAAQMLPQIFRPDSPVFQLALPPEHQQRLERLVINLPPETFSASDSLGWVYQFWQTNNKERINKSEVKIGARELPAVTQLFTEPYMVSFLLDNSLGAWWAARRLSEADLKTASSEAQLRDRAAIPGVPLEYLRFVKSPSPSGRGARGEGQKAFIPTDILNNARELRKNQTDAEQLLWGLLRDRSFANKKFRRQHPIGRYILDFYCHEAQLAIELDGGQHNETSAKRYDAERSQFLTQQGIHVIRFWNNEVLQQTDAVLESLWNTLTPTPLPEGEGLIWTPAAGTFAQWPQHLSDLKTLDPCCGSGHFLVAALLMLVPMRMALDGLTAREAVDHVLSENLHGLELDQRCVELAAFALALTAWRYPDAGGYRPLPELHIACTGLAVSVAKEEWKQLGLGKKNLTIALDWLHDTFKDAPVLGSLLNPTKTQAANLVHWDELSQTLNQALKMLPSPSGRGAGGEGDEQHEIGVVAQGLAKAATLLAGQYQWVITNVPYLARGKQDERLRDFCERHYPAAKNDLATVFLDRCLQLCVQGGTASIVLPQNWLFLTSYRKFREQLLNNDTWHLLARLGPGSFETISGEVVKAILINLSRGNKGNTDLLIPNSSMNVIRGIDVSISRTAIEKAMGLQNDNIKNLEQAKQLKNPDARVALEDAEDIQLLGSFAFGYQGIASGDYSHFGRVFWELPKIDGGQWVFQQSTVEKTCHFGGKEHVLYWESGEGDLSRSTAARVQGLEAWDKWGIAAAQMGQIPVTLHTASSFDNNTASIILFDKSNLHAIWSFCSSPEYQQTVRRIDQKLNVTNATLVKVPFDLDRWTKIAEEKYPNGLPQPYSNDPTQWIFHGHPCGSVVWEDETKWTTQGPLRTGDTVLQVAVARLLGYRWPAELDTDMELAEHQRDWVKCCEALSLTPTLSQGERGLIDEDGIVCLPPVRGEAAAADRLLNLLAAAYGDSWSNDILAQLLGSADHAGKTLETWLREKFFSQHCKLFQQRPFIWHIWDGLRDGFAALVNYHKFDAKLLETLIYTYLGDWISRQKQDISNGIDGAAEKLAAAENLKKKLELILVGEAPYDIFVRWKPLDQQAVGWNPDLNDGVRLNIRPFLSVPDVGKKGAAILRDKPNIKWEKDRGKDVESAPWYHLFNGDRINDHHLKLAEKLAARDKEKL